MNSDDVPSWSNSDANLPCFHTSLQENILLPRFETHSNLMPTVRSLGSKRTLMEDICHQGQMDGHSGQSDSCMSERRSILMMTDSGVIIVEFTYSVRIRSGQRITRKRRRNSQRTKRNNH